MFTPFWEGQHLSTESSVSTVPLETWNYSTEFPHHLSNGSLSTPSYETKSGAHTFESTSSIATTGTKPQSQPDPYSQQYATMTQPGSHTFQRTASRVPAETNPYIQSDPHSQFSTSTSEIIYSILKDKSDDELRMILMDKNMYNKVLHSIGEAKHLNSLRNDLRMKTIQMARRNLEYASRIAELRNQCTIIRTTELAVAEEKIQELEKKEKELAVLTPPSLLEKLKDSARLTDEDSERLQSLFYSNEIDMTFYLQQYKKLRAVYHWRMLVHLAGMSSLS